MKKRVLIVGSSGAIGSSLSDNFIRKNYECVGTSSKDLDLTNKESIEAFIKDLSNVDGVIFASGKKPMMNLKDLEWNHLNDMIDIHYRGVIWTIKNIISKINDGGFIILTSSVSAYRGGYDPTYSSLKSAVDGLVRTLSKELAPKVRVNSVAPGLVLDTPVYDEMTDDFLQNHINSTPLRKLATMDEICNAYIFLSENGHITGQTIHINGGQYF